MSRNGVFSIALQVLQLATILVLTPAFRSNMVQTGRELSRFVEIFVELTLAN